jgi:hypothetical protein
VFILKIMWIKKNQFSLDQTVGIFISTIILCFYIYVPSAKAESLTTLSFTPSKNVVKANKDLKLAVHLNTGGQTVNAVQADVSYPLNLFDPAKSKVHCSKAFPTQAENKVNGTINIGGSSKGLIKVACAVPVNGGAAVVPFAGETDIATITLHARSAAPSVHDYKMLEFVIDKDISDGRNNYSAVARASDSTNILGNVGTADITVTSQNNSYSKLDINKDTTIDSKDLSTLISNFGKNNSSADINDDHLVDCTDLSILLSSQ